MNKNISENSNFQKSKETFYQYLLNMGYSANGLYNFKWVLNSLGHYLNENGKILYTKEDGLAFLNTIIYSNRYTAESVKSFSRVLRRYEDFVSGREYRYSMSST